MRRKTVEINGKEFEIQTIPFMSYMEITDRNMGPHGIPKQAGMIKELFENCVIKPKVTMSDFDDDFNTAMKLVNEIESFLKSEPDRKQSKEKSE